MKIGRTQFLILLSALIFAGSIYAGETSDINTNYLWDIGYSGFWDATNNEYEYADGEVIVDLRNDFVLCPTGLGEVTGKRNISDIHFLFDSQEEGDFWFHVTWNPGRSGVEQFEVSCNSSPAVKSRKIQGWGVTSYYFSEKFKVKIVKGQNELVIQRLSGNGLDFYSLYVSDSEEEFYRPRLYSKTKVTNLRSFEKECGEPCVMLDGEHIRFFAPKKYERQAAVYFRYLTRAYDELHRITGLHTQYKMNFFNFPEGNKSGWGGTCGYGVEYSAKGLDLSSQSEWKKYKVPHICGHIEEMAHNFVRTSKVQFGWEMVGWSIGIKATQKVADNPIFEKSLKRTRENQTETFKRYMKAGGVFPEDIEENLSDRIHAYLLWQCEKQYGKSFWKDFFSEVRKVKEDFDKADRAYSGDENKNKRYQVSVECFDRLPKLNFKRVLEKSCISLTVDVKSLHPRNAGWDRRLIAAGE